MSEPGTTAQAPTRDERRAALTRKSKTQLITMCKNGIRKPGGGRVYIEGAYPLAQWRKDEIITSILDVEHPVSPAGLTCDCGGRVPWPPEAGTTTCQYCRNVWEYADPDSAAATRTDNARGYGARLHVPASGPLTVACPSCSAPPGGQCTGHDFCHSRQDAAS